MPDVVRQFRGMGVSVRLLGPVEVDGGSSLAPRDLLVLTALIVRDGQRMTAGELADAVWGDAPPTSWRKQLQSCIGRLRVVVGPSAIETVRAGYRAQMTELETDVYEFEELVAAGRLHASDGRHDAAVTSLRSALELWRGEALAQLERWDAARSMLARLEELRRDVEEEWLVARLAAGEHRSVCVDAKALAEEAPLRERRWAILALAQYRSAQQADALRSIARARDLLRDEMGLSIGSELAALEAAILRHDASLQVEDVTRKRDSAGVAVQLPSTLRQALRRSLVGRRQGIERAERMLDAALDGDSNALLILGEAGIGKTRMAAAIAEAAAARGLEVLYGRCDEAITSPFRAVIEALRPWSADHERRPPAAPDASSRNIAQGTDEAADAPVDGIGETQRARWFDSITRLVDRRVESRPVLLVIDDLHWAEPSTRLLLAHLARNVSGGFLLIGTARAGPGLQPSTLIGDPGTGVGIEVERLSGLGEPEVASLISTLVGDRPPGEFTADVRRLTGGNPYFVAALLAQLHDVSFVRDESGSWATHAQLLDAGVPEVVRVVTSRRLGLLPDEARPLLEVGAICGLQFDERIARRVCDLPTASVIEALESAAAAGLVVEEDGGRFTFTHTLVRQALLDEISRTRMAWLHWSVAAQLDHGDDAADHLEEIAHHYLQGLSAGDVDTAARASTAAGSDALRRLAFEEAVAHLRRSLELVGTTPSDLPIRYDVVVLLGHSLNALESAEEAELVWLDAMTIARQLRDPVRLFDAVMGYRYIHRQSFGRDLVECIDEVLALLDPGDSPTRAIALAFRSAPSLRSDLTSVPQVDPELADHAVDMARRTGDRSARVSTLRARLSIRSQLPDVDALRSDVAELAGLEPVGFDAVSRDRSAVLRELVRGYLRLAERSTAELYLEAAEDEVRRNALPIANILNALLRSALASASGRFAEAERVTKSAREGAAGAPTLTTLMLAAQALSLRMERGHSDQVVAALRQLKDTPASRGWIAMLPVALAEAGQSAEASAVFDRLVASASDSGDYATALAARFLPEACRRLGAADSARALLPSVEPWTGQLLVVATGISIEGAADRSIGHLHAALGQYADADIAYQRAVDLERDAGFPPHVARTAYWHAHMLLERQSSADRSRALIMLDEAIEIAVRLGMQILESEARQLKQRATGGKGADATRPPPSGRASRGSDEC